MSAGYPEFRWYRGTFRPKIYSKYILGLFYAAGAARFNVIDNKEG